MPAKKSSCNAKPKAKRKTKATAEGIAPAVLKAPKPAGYVFGRPTKYNDAYCEQVVEWGRAGKSRTWMAANIGVDRDTLDNWAASNPDFFGALSLAKALEQAFWEDLGFSGLTADRFNSGVWTKSMAARFPNEWRDSQNITAAHSGSMSLAHNIEFHVIDPSQNQG